MGFFSGFVSLLLINFFDNYNLCTLIFFLNFFIFIISILINGFGSLFLSSLLRVPNLIFPRLHNANFWLLVFSLFLFFITILLEIYLNLYVIDLQVCNFKNFTTLIMVISIHLICFSFICSALNFGITIVLTFKRVPLFEVSLYCWFILMVCLLLVLYLPILAAISTTLFYEINLNSNIVDYRGEN